MRGAVAELAGGRPRAAARAADDRERPRAGRGPVVLGRARDALCLASALLGERAGGPRRAREALLARGERLGRRRDRPARPARRAVRRARATRSGSTSRRSRSSPVPLELGDWTLVTLDSGATHSHAGSGYNERRRECREACAALGISSLREATRDRRPARAAARPRPPRADRERPRRRHGRARCAPATSRRSGACSTPRTPACATTTPRRCPRSSARWSALKEAGAAGARMVGGGFGGAVLALLPPGRRRPRRGARRRPRAPRRGSSEPSSSDSGRVSAQVIMSSAEDEHAEARPTG